MNSRRYVICDIEATGLDEDREIIEIALITWEDDQVLEVYETLINPLRTVPDSIHQLTAISRRELQEAPKFYEVAEAIKRRLEGNVFVSHNTDFDLGLLQKKYRELGEDLKVKSFCTLKVAQQEIPGLKNYNLDALCSFFHIKINNRHRASGDAEATLKLFVELLDLRLKVKPIPLYLPHHEKELKKLPHKAGLLKFRDTEGKIVLLEPAFDLEKRARELLRVRQENRELLLATETITGEDTGSALIAEFKQLMHRPYRPNWMITLEEKKGEKFFRVKPWKKGFWGLWYFMDYREAKSKLGMLKRKPAGESFAYREGGISKEELLKKNREAENLAREGRFPTDHLVIVGEGRSMDEKSLILIRDGHVIGYGYSDAPLEEIYERPEAFLIQRFSRHLGMDLAALRYLRVLKNLKSKKEGWRSLADHARMAP